MSSSRPSRVALVVASLRILGGQAVQAQRNLEGFSADPDFDVWLVPNNPVPPAPFDKLLSIKFVRTVVTQLLYWPLLVRELRHADVVHAYSASYTSFLLAPLPAILVARLLGKPVLLNYHSGEAPDHLRRSAVARFALRRLVDLNVVPSSFLRDVFASHQIPAIVVPNSIDVERFKYRVRDLIGPRLVSTRSFETLYNIECTLDAFALIQVAYPDATLTLVGGGSQEQALRRRVEQLGLRHVRFVGRVAPDQIHRYYDEADIYIQTPAIDNMPLSVLEAFASGLPVVSTRIGGVPAMLENGALGYLAADNDPADVARQVDAILADPAEARRRAATARATCDAYAWPRVHDGWVSAYRALLEQAIGGPSPAHGPAPRRSALDRSATPEAGA
jgi:glycosyltransferase involved in cell wall biosynthesis